MQNNKIGIMKGCIHILMFNLCILTKFLQGDYVPCQKGNPFLCEKLTNKECEIHCPPVGGTKIILHTVKGENFRLYCRVPEYDISIFPSINAGNLDLFYIQSCNLPSSFNLTIEKFKISKIEFMKLEELQNTTVNTVTKNLFLGLSALKRLYFVSSPGIKLEENFLENIPNLKKLYLYNNSIKEIKRNMFHYTTKLKKLELSKNSITSVPEKVFQDLYVLLQLYLNNNKINTLYKYSFTGLRQLEILELSYNQIKYIDEDTFAELSNLEQLSLQGNDLHVIASNLFKHNTALEEVRIGYNPTLNLSDYVLGNLTNLKKINIDNSKLKNLPQHIFEGSNNISDISLQDNNIKEFPENFKGLFNLRKLNLKGNKLAIVTNGILFSLKNLEVLNLKDNKLTEIDEKLFENNFNLKWLGLQNNMVSKIDNLTYCKKLQKIDLSRNIIENFPEGIINNKPNLTLLNLNQNKIKYLKIASLTKLSSNKVKVDLNNNNISTLDFGDIKNKTSHNKMSSTVLIISNNPISCNCNIFDLIQYNNGNLNPVVKKMVDIKMDDLRCYIPQRYKNKLVKDLKPHNVMCPLESERCPKQCTCDYRPDDKCAVIDCSNRNLTKTPTINVTDINIEQIEINLEGNKLETAPYEGLGYNNVTKLFLSNNRIRNLSWVPPKIKILELNENQLKFMASEVLHSLHESVTLERITLQGNPWICDCSADGLQKYLKKYYTKVNSTDVKCENNIALINIKELCVSNMTIAMIMMVHILVVLFAMTVAVALYFYYQTEIKAWLYVKNLCLWFVNEDELDEGKTYDIFISYSHKDEEFLIQDLLCVLESGSNPFKICIPDRDWVPGELIQTQVTNSVRNSKRTLVILSESFLVNEWRKVEFRTAHTQAIKEGHARIIIVKYGKLNKDELDGELTTYLNTNTYLEWGDPWFWNKLKYALPHSRNTKYYIENQKRAYNKVDTYII